MDYDFRIKTAFEVVEHLPSLPAFLSEAVGEVDLFFSSTELRGVGLIPDDNWWYYAFGMGQHIGFHSKRVLQLAFDALGTMLSLINHGSSLHALGATKIWRAAFSIAKRIWRLQRVAGLPDRLYSRVFKESRLTIPDHLHALKLLG